MNWPRSPRCTSSKATGGWRGGRCGIRGQARRAAGHHIRYRWDHRESRSGREWRGTAQRGARSRCRRDGGIAPAGRCGLSPELPAIDLAEVGAGGGSICRLDAGGAPKVGPESAGADPDQCATAAAAPSQPSPTATLSWAISIRPASWAARWRWMPTRRRRHRAIAGRAAEAISGGSRYGMLRLASASMMRAIRAVSVERGRDPRQFALLAFGGNGRCSPPPSQQSSASAVSSSTAARRVQRVRVAGGGHRTSCDQSLRMRLDEADAARIESVLDADCHRFPAAGARWRPAGATQLPPCRAGPLCRAVERDRGTRLMAISCRASPNCWGGARNPIPLSRAARRTSRVDGISVIARGIPTARGYRIASRRCRHRYRPAGPPGFPISAGTRRRWPIASVSPQRRVVALSLFRNTTRPAWCRTTSTPRVTHSEISGSPARPDGRGALWERFPVSRESYSIPPGNLRTLSPRRFADP